MILKKEYRAAYEVAHSEASTAAGEREQDNTNTVRDVYGGITPEETFTKFIAALKAGDIALASRYVVMARQAEWQESLALLKTGGGLTALAEELEAIRQIWKKDESGEGLTRYTYEKPLHDGTTSAQAIVFEKDDAVGTWKIREL